MNQNFTASEFSVLQARSKAAFEELITSLKNISDLCRNMSNVVVSGDSGLASRWENIAGSIDNVVSSTNNTNSAIDSMMTSYAENTIANEEDSAVDLGSIDEEIGTINEHISGLVDLFDDHGGYGHTEGVDSIGRLPGDYHPIETPIVPDTPYEGPFHGPYSDSGGAISAPYNPGLPVADEGMGGYHYSPGPTGTDSMLFSHPSPQPIHNNEYNYVPGTQVVREGTTE